MTTTSAGEKNCGVVAVTRVTSQSYEQVREEFIDAFGSISVNGAQMRRYLTQRGWTWVNSRIVPNDGEYLVVCRNGFYAIHFGRTIDDDRKGAVCGYYRKAR